ncbi:MAG: ATP-dependent DNA ligase [Planctomycetota bacterium]
MKRFTDLYLSLDATTKTNDKVAAMRDYFATTPPRDACWAVAALAGKGITRTVRSALLRKWAAEASGYEPWLLDACYGVVGDLSETLALIVPDPTAQDRAEGDEPLHVFVEQRLQPLAILDEAGQKKLVLDTWRRYDREGRLMFHKLLRGALRVGVSRGLVVRAIAEVAGLDAAVVDHRLTGRWRPSAEAYAALLAREQAADAPGKPYPFMLASQLDIEPDTLGPVADWQLEWKWDGIRAQLIYRRGQVYIWSRGEESVADGFPEVVAAAATLKPDAVFDGELLAWEDGRPLAFGVLQKRIGRKRVELSLFPEVPVVFMAYDLLELDGRDTRGQALAERRALLESTLAGTTGLELSPRVSAEHWRDVSARVGSARERGVEGLVLKRRDSVYAGGRARGPWWKWKADPYTIDAVLVQGQQGSGRRAGLYTSYTFAVWDNGELVPVTKAYSGLSNDEIERVDRYIRKHTVARHGPVRVVEPDLVFEIAFEGLQESTRHKSGVAFRFPRMSRWREDKQAKDADTLASVKQLLRAHTGG